MTKSPKPTRSTTREAGSSGCVVGRLLRKKGSVVVEASCRGVKIWGDDSVSVVGRLWMDGRVFTGTGILDGLGVGAGGFLIGTGSLERGRLEAGDVWVDVGVSVCTATEVTVRTGAGDVGVPVCMAVEVRVGKGA